MSLRGLKLILQVAFCTALMAGSASAVTLSPGDSFFDGAVHNTEGGFSDLYQFDTTAAPIGTVTISAKGIIGNIGDLTVQWLNAAFIAISPSLVVTNADGSNTGASPLAFVLADVATYYLRVTGIAGVGPATGGSYEIAVATTPIPPALLLFGSALAGLGFLGRRRRATAGPLA
jgi:hypothetical protein